MSDLNRDSHLYTTGEIAKLCGVSVRTVQYYDSRAILVPSQLSEGGRRLYSEEDVNKLRIICFLRDAGLPLSSIGELFAENQPENVISILLDRQALLLREEINERERQLELVEQIRRELKNIAHFSVESIGDIAHMMKNRKKMRQVRISIFIIAMIGELVEISTILLWILKGLWQPYVFVGLPFVIALSIWAVLFYFRRVDFICPGCHAVFTPSFKEMFWAKHTATTRKLTCPHCHRKGFCVETYRTENVTYD